MPKPKKIIDIYPPKGLKERYHFPVGKDIEKGGQIVKIERKKGSRFKKSLFFVFLFLIASVLFLHFVLARVSIEIWPETENLNLDEQVTADIKTEQFDLAAKVIPGEFFETEKSTSQQFNSSGKVMKEKNAQGIIRVYNNYSSSQTLVKNTRFQPASENVIYFRSLKTVVIPAKTYLDIEVKADRAGEEYNITPATFSVPGLAGLPQYYSVYAKSFSQMTGGFKGLVSQVSKEDLETAQKSLSEKLKEETKDYFATESNEGFIFLDEGMVQEILEASSSVPVGNEADSFNFNLKVKTKAIAFRKSDLDNFVKELIASKILDISGDASPTINLKIQDSGKKAEEQSLKIEYSVDKADLESGKIILNVKISAKVYSDINEEDLKKYLFGKSIKESQVLLEEQSTITKVKLNVFPPWLRGIPENKDKIKIKLNID